MRPCWIRVGPKSDDFIRERRRFEHRHAQGEEGHVKTEAGIGMMYPQAKDCWPPPVPGRGKEGFFPRDFRGSMALVSDSWPAGLLGNKCMLFEAT